MSNCSFNSKTVILTNIHQKIQYEIAQQSTGCCYFEFGRILFLFTSSHNSHSVNLYPCSCIYYPRQSLATSPIELAFFIKRSPVEFFEPKPEVRDSFNRIEKTMVGYADDQFFVRQPELVLDLADLEEGAFVFPLPGGRVLSPYGRRNGRNHTGIDLKTIVGTPFWQLSTGSSE